MLSFTRKTDYALISLTHIASEGNNCCSAREIATRYRMPMPLLMNILKVLTQHGIARSERGPRGGYQLARPADQISVYDVIRAVDGPVSLVYCVPLPGEDADREVRESCGCELTSVCPVRGPVHRIHHHLVRLLKEVSLAELAENAVHRDSRSALDLGEPTHEVAHLPG